MSEKKTLEESPLLIIAAVVPFYLNDLWNPFLKSYSLFLFLDVFVVRLLPLAIIAWVIRRGSVSRAEVGLSSEDVTAKLALVTLIALVVTVLIDQFAARFVQQLFGPLFRTSPPPQPPSFALAAVDWLVIGALVALSEELVFRGLLWSALDCQWSEGGLLISAILFGGMHANGGVGAIISASMAGIFLGMLRRKTRSIWPLVAVHYLVNALAFTLAYF